MIVFLDDVSKIFFIKKYNFFWYGEIMTGNLVYLSVSLVIKIQITKIHATKEVEFW